MKKCSQTTSTTLGLAAGLALTFAALATSAQASTILYDGLDYSAGALTGNNGGTGFNAAWAHQTAGLQVVSPGLSYTGLASVGNAASDNSTGTFFSQRTFDTAFTGGKDSSNAFWFSAQFFVPTTTTSSDFRIIFLGSTSTDLSAGFQVKINGSGTIQAQADANVSTGSLSYTKGVTNLIVGRIQLGSSSDSVELWLNPTSQPSVSSGLMASESDVFFGSTAALNVRGGGNFVGTADEFRLGTTFSDVVVAIPEPSSYSLIAGGLAVLVCLRRRRRSI